jgi:hypothetical protein
MLLLQVAMRAFLIKTVVIGCLHCVVSVLLYRGMVVNQFPKSELLVFDLPALIALIAYGIIFWTSGFLQAKLGLRIAIMLGFSLLAAGLSSWLFMLIAFNKYGT